MLKRLLFGMISFISVAFASIEAPLNREPLSFVFIVDSNYVSHCFETVFTLKTAMPNVNKNVIVLIPEIAEDSRKLLTELLDENTRVILRNINTIPCINKDAMDRYKTTWSPLINVRWQLFSVIDWLNKQPDFIEELFDRKSISSYMSLDSDLWILNDLSDLFTRRSFQLTSDFSASNPNSEEKTITEDVLTTDSYELKHNPIISAPLSPISINNYEEIVLNENSSPIEMGISSGVLLFHLNEIIDPEEFTKLVSKKLEERWNEHNLLYSDLFYSLTKMFMDQNEESKNNLKDFLNTFLEKTKGIAINGESDKIISILQENFKHSNESLKEFINLMEKIVKEIGNTKWEFCHFYTDALFGFILEIEKYYKNAESSQDDYRKALLIFPIDETALDEYTDKDLLIKYNFNPKDLFPSLSLPITASGFPEFSEIHNILISKNEEIKKTISENGEDVFIFHFDGCIKPWNTSDLNSAIEKDDRIARIQEFYNKIKNRSLDQNDLESFRNFLREIANAL